VSFVPVLLATDALIWLLVVAGAAYAWYCSRHEHLAAPWGRVLRSPAAIGSAVVLAAYLLVALADSLHFRPALERKDSKAPIAYSVNVNSLLDAVVSHLRGRAEKTYSAPLATRSFDKEQIERPDGTIVRDYPRLRFGGAHLADESGRAADVAAKALSGLAAAAVLWALIALALRPLRNGGNWCGDVYAGGRGWPIPFGRSHVVVRAPCENSRGGLLAYGNPCRLCKAVGDRRERGPVGFVYRSLLRGHQAQQHRTIRCRDRGSNRRIGCGVRRNTVGGIPFGDGVDGLVDGGLHHCQRSIGGGWRQAGGDHDVVGGDVPVRDHVGHRCWHPKQRRQRDWQHHPAEIPSVVHEFVLDWLGDRWQIAV